MLNRRHRCSSKPAPVAPLIDASTKGGNEAQAMKRAITLPPLEKIYGKGVQAYYQEGCLYVGGKIVAVRRY